MDGRTLDYVALAVLICVVLTFIYGIIYIHDIPYEIAKKRNHPHQDAIHTAGWVSLFLMHTIWPFLWIWASLYKPDLGWGFGGRKQEPEGPGVTGKDAALLQELQQRLQNIEKLYGDTERGITNEVRELSTRVFELEKRLMKNSGE